MQNFEWYVYLGRRPSQFILIPTYEKEDESNGTFLCVVSAPDVFTAVRLAKESLAYALYYDTHK